MHLTFLGTASGAPSRLRNVSALALSLDDGEVWLLDCGEGTQHRLQQSDVRAGRIRRVLVTHLHGDHCFGLPGLLSSLGIHGRREAVELIGPRGLARFVEVALGTSETVLPFPLDICELDRPELLGRRGSLDVEAHVLPHRVPCFGYVLRQPERRGRLDIEAARRLGVPEGPLLGELARGRAVRLASGRLVQPEEVVGPPRPGLHLVLLGDTYDASPIAEAARGCDLLVHEATYDARYTDKARQWGHSTAAQAGRFAAEVGARKLVITHFSARYDDPSSPVTVAHLRHEAQAECPGTEVIAAHDLLRVELVPK